MIEFKNRIVKYKEIKNESTQRFGGWAAYFKLYGKFLKQLKTYRDVGVGLHIRAYMNLSMLTQTLFKPLKQFYSVTIVISGKYKVVDGVFENISVKKTVHHRIFSMYFWNNKVQLSETDVRDLIE